jgi:hypothetical protein
MTESIINLFFLFSRYVHIVATTLIVGGTLFFEMVVPAAIGELKTEVQLAVFGRMRWIFRWVVYTSAAALILTGSVSAFRSNNKAVLNGQFVSFLSQSSSDQKMKELQNESVFNRPVFWFVGHLVAGVLSLGIAVSLVRGGTPPERPIQWMRLNLFVLLLAMFFASASRSARQNLFQPVMAEHSATQPAHE